MNTTTVGYLLGHSPKNGTRDNFSPESGIAENPLGVSVQSGPVIGQPSPVLLYGEK